MSRSKPGFRAGRDQGAITENLELLTGQRGNGLDKAVTVRQLAELGLARLRKMGSNIYVPSFDAGLITGGNGDAPQIPTKPLNMAANGAFHNVLLSWDKPNYRGHSYTEIWRAPTDNLAEAELVGTTNANLYADAVGAALKAWYWVRFVNINNQRGPYTGPGGVYAETSRAIDDILEEMAGELSESYLTKHLQDRISLVDGPTSLPGSVASRLAAETQARVDAILGEASARASAVTTEKDERTSADGALGQRIDTVVAKAGENAALIQQETTARTSADGALGQRIDTVVAKAGENAAAIQTTNQAIADINADGSAAYQALWSIKALAADITAGIGLLARSDGTSEFAVAAGRMAVFDPASPTTKDNLFVVEGGKVYMNTAFIKQAFIEQLAAAQITADRVNALVANIVSAQIVDAAITRAKLAQAVIGSAQIDALAVGSAHIQDLSVDTLKIAGSAVSVPIGVYTQDNITLSNGGSWSTVQSLVIPDMGYPVNVLIGFSCRVSKSDSVGTGAGIVDYQLLRDGSSLLQAENLNAYIDDGMQMLSAARMSSANGATSITLRVRRVDNYASVAVGYRTLYVIVLKR
ncbi:putative phage tail protein [Oceanisphaera litoralis]|uniref:phage tail tip fiber protein n=1 Tax=Oceanisphaera litoralis TaxID=225144 RepID=UPI00195D3563|nr:DUF1983 domain-containing protein [Oceanisphaera litoralis]MBM7455167.1 putative phage tail protein [Oceanisphaera litoralis]